MASIGGKNMGRVMIFVVGALVGLAFSPLLRNPQARDLLHNLFKEGVKSTIRFGRQLQALQEELSEEIEDAAAEAVADLDGEGEEAGTTGPR